MKQENGREQNNWKPRTLKEILADERFHNEVNLYPTAAYGWCRLLIKSGRGVLLKVRKEPEFEVLDVSSDDPDLDVTLRSFMRGNLQELLEDNPLWKELTRKRNPGEPWVKQLPQNCTGNYLKLYEMRLLRKNGH